MKKRKVGPQNWKLEPSMKDPQDGVDGVDGVD